MKTIVQNLKLDKPQFIKLKEYSKHSNSLYNCCLYEVKNFYENTGQYLGISKLDKLMQKNKHYKAIPSFHAQQIVRLVDKNYRSFFALLKRKLAGKYTDKVNPPKYRKPGDFFILVFDNTRIYVKNQKLKLYKDLKLDFNYEIGKIKQGIIKWTGNNFIIHITYESDKQEKKGDNGKYLSIDFGVNNFASCVSNVGQSFIVNGRQLKSINQFYNKNKARLQSKLKNQKWSKQLQILTNKRRRRINHFMWSSISYITKQCLNSNINTIILGYNINWKQNCNIGKINNQNFQSIPFADFRQKLQSKCDELGINLVIIDESYTSKTSFVDNEKPENTEFVGRRIKRGLFKTSSGKLVNADCNAAAQIMSKHVILNRDERDKIGAVIVTPSLINVV